MKLDVERELREAMNDFTAGIQAPPDLLDRLGARPPRFPRLRAGIAAVAGAWLVLPFLLVAEQLPGVRHVAPTAPSTKPLSVYHATTDHVTPNDRATRDLHAAI